MKFQSELKFLMKVKIVAHINLGIKKNYKLFSSEHDY